ncbi:hypothetical protein [Gordonia sp. MP11Mi]|uniref:Uncharacterized protein n=1 Tax=Gordonia sp. MP11Mi TaxID=3022769 RepID=A0AA97CXE0_9ACTN
MPDRTVAPVTGTGAVVFDDEARGDTVLRTATGRFHHLIDPPGDLVAHLAGLAHQNAAHQNAAHPNADVDDYVERLRDEIVDRERADAQSRWPDHRRNVAVIGSGPIVADITTALNEIGVRVQRHEQAIAVDPAAVDPAAIALVVAVTDDPTHLDHLDDLPRVGVAWLRAYREDSVWFVDPVSTTPSDPSARQVARRRLAAQPVPRHSQGWHRGVRSAAPEPTALERVRVADRLLAVALAWAQDDPFLTTYRRTLWKYIAATGRVSEHPVLPYPEPAPR